MFDTHAHLNFEDFEGRISEILTECQARGVEKILIPGTDLEMSKKAIDLAQEYDNLYAAVGIHPADISDDDSDYAEIIEKVHRLSDITAKVRAIGEIGLDRYFIFKKYGTFREDIYEKQKIMFTAQFHLAKETHRAVIIHNRQSKKDLIQILENNWEAYYARNVVIHCCEPDQQILEFCIDHNIFIGVDGDVTYSPEKQAFLHKIPLNILVLETDSPFLTPEPPRLSKETKYPNTPVNLPYITQKIAEIKDEDVQTIVRETTNNAMELFTL